MSDPNRPSMPPEAAVMQLIFSKVVFFSMAAAARLGIADHLTDTPQTVAEIAASSGTNEDALYRILRLLASLGLFREEPLRSFAITPAGELLRSDHPHSLRDMAIMYSDPWQIETWASIPDVVTTGKDAPSQLYGGTVFDYFVRHPQEGENFHRAMSSFSGGSADAVLQVADFSRFQRMADCGGGHGLLLSRILTGFPNLRGVLYDLPEVVAGATASGYTATVSNRLDVESGSFFERVPEGCDAYIMKHILHDWSDESCRQILSLMREQLAKFAPETGRVFICEMIVNESPEPSPAKMLDIEMLVQTPGGRERTEGDFARLFASAGLRLVGVTPTASPVCLIEAAL